MVISLSTSWIPKIKTKRYYASDDLIDDLIDHGAHFLWADRYAYYATTKNIPKEQLDEFMNKIYIEPVWSFSKKIQNLH
jgi:hypothetical protein